MVIVKRGDKWCVESHKTGRSLGCYDTRPEAEARLKQVQRFKNKYRVKMEEL